METLVAPLAVAIAKSLLPAAIAAATAALGQAFAWLRSKTHSTTQANAVDLLNELVFTVVHDLTQTMAAALKAAAPDGKLSPGDAQKVKDEALRKIKAYYSVNNGLAYLAKALRIPDNEILDLIASKIEAAVYQTKAAGTLVEETTLPTFGGMTADEKRAAGVPVPGSIPSPGLPTASK